MPGIAWKAKLSSVDDVEDDNDDDVDMFGLFMTASGSGLGWSVGSLVNLDQARPPGSRSANITVIILRMAMIIVMLEVMVISMVDLRITMVRQKANGRISCRESLLTKEQVDIKSGSIWQHDYLTDPATIQSWELLWGLINRRMERDSGCD